MELIFNKPEVIHQNQEKKTNTNINPEVISQQEEKQKLKKVSLE